MLLPLIRPSFHSLCYTLLLFGLTAWAWESIVTQSGLKRCGLAVLDAAVIAIGAWLTRRAQQQLQPLHGRFRLILIVTSLSLVLILCSLVANVLGYVGLSRVLRSGTFLSVYSAVALYTAYVVTAGFLRALVQTRRQIPEFSGGVRSETVTGWSVRLMGLAMIVVWWYIMLNSFTIREPVMAAISYVLRTPIKLRAVSFSLEDVLTFIIVLVCGIGLAGIIKVVLNESLLGRTKLKRGIPYAISTMTYYLLLLGVFLLALSSAGVALSKFTVLTGAFGVGAGFGLQNVINNFVSGIILLFERPVRIGDFLEVERTMGELTRMGMRSSSLRTPQGAEVIVPNSNLISREVINWTLSEQKRRTELLVKAAYGADPDKVAETLVRMALSHPNVAREPHPVVFFLGFGDNSVDFELHCWVPKTIFHKKVNSEVALRIAREFRELGIEIPAPKRELHVFGHDSVKRLLEGVEATPHAETPRPGGDSETDERPS